MSRVVQTIARVALPIAGAALGGPVGAAIGGAIGGAAGGGGIRGAVLGGLTGYMGAGSAANLLGTPAASGVLWNTPGQAINWAAPGVSLAGSGLRGMATGGGMAAMRNTFSGATNALVPGMSGSGIPGMGGNDPLRSLLGIGNQLMTQDGAKTAERAARIQSEAIQRGIDINQPFAQLGTEAASQIRNIQNDPAGYIRNNPLYNSLASDAERRLLANQAARGKVGSGGTAAALQEQLLNLGNSLMSQDINRLQGQVNTGLGAAGSIAGQFGQQGDVNAAGQVGAFNAFNAGYQNQLNTLLALNNMRGQYGSSQPVFR